MNALIWNDRTAHLGAYLGFLRDYELLELKDVTGKCTLAAVFGKVADEEEQ